MSHSADRALERPTAMVTGMCRPAPSALVVGAATQYRRRNKALLEAGAGVWFPEERGHVESHGSEGAA